MIADELGERHSVLFDLGEWASFSVSVWDDEEDDEELEEAGLEDHEAE